MLSYTRKSRQRNKANSRMSENGRGLARPGRESPPEPVAPNKANSPPLARAGEAGQGRPRHCEGEFCKTKPIWRNPAEVGGPNVQNKPNFGDLAGWTQGPVVQTKPIWGSPAGIPRPIMQNKPSWQGRYPTIPSLQSSRPESVVPNKANHRGERNNGKYCEEKRL